MDDPGKSELERARQLAMMLALIDHAVKVCRALSVPFVPVAIRRRNAALRGTALPQIQHLVIGNMLRLTAGLVLVRKAGTANGGT